MAMEERRQEGENKNRLSDESCERASRRIFWEEGLPKAVSPFGLQLKYSTLTYASAPVEFGNKAD